MARRTMREWRAYLNLSKQDVGRSLGIHPSTYAKWERNPEEIKVCDIERIADAFKCDPKEIIFFEGNPSLKLGFFNSNHGKDGQSVEHKLEAEVSV
ncbi:helix-turn-helix domain-containing protein [Paenibacillus wynnii]|uniref:HTH cro/C1-type domain-containing protein n=1 Tax=Paenibacillus wynnii TaxID=268407 RepID=A0A098M8V5_9BACL|nr:helix-turn-helix transcriptional regulator [Paenibacillus wynnii]KGE18483.1 hypothetical protein PWYN_03185 [Paenibacillus wynnii]